jgi:hypothetical protein
MVVQKPTVSERRTGKAVLSPMYLQREDVVELQWTRHARDAQHEHHITDEDAVRAIETAFATLEQADAVGTTPSSMDAVLRW